MNTKRPVPRNKRPETAPVAVLTAPTAPPIAEVAHKIDAIDKRAENLLYDLYDGEHYDADILTFHQLGDSQGFVRGTYLIYCADNESGTHTVDFRQIERVGDSLTTKEPRHMNLSQDADERQDQITIIVHTFQWAHELQ